MTNEELILKKLEHIESHLEPAIKLGQSLKELKDDLVPLGNTAVNLITNELQEIEAGFELEDLFILTKQTLRSTRDLAFMLNQLTSIVEFMKDLEPLMKSAIPLIIGHLDKLEQRGVFRMITAMTDIRAKVASTYDHEDIDQIGDVMVNLLGLAKKLSDPKAMELLEKLAELPANVDLTNTKKIGPFKMISAGFNNEVKEGLGVMIELTKAMGKLKGTGQEETTAAPGN
jgi:uncharacterized protein YjgD (DUF1641 family)